METRLLTIIPSVLAAGLMPRGAKSGEVQGGDHLFFELISDSHMPRFNANTLLLEGFSADDIYLVLDDVARN